MASRISSATAPATAAIGVMKVRSQYGATAATIRLAINAGWKRAVYSRRLSQKREFAAEFIEHMDETLGRRPVSGVDLTSFAECLDDQIDRSIMKMQPAAILQQSYLGPRLHSPGLGDFSGCQRPRVVRIGRESAAPFSVHDGIERTNVVHVAAQRGVVLNLQGELYGRNQRWRRHIAKSMFRHAADVHHERDAAAGPDVNRRAATGDSGQRVAHRVR